MDRHHGDPLSQDPRAHRLPEVTVLPHRRAAARRRTRPRRLAPARRHDTLWTLALGVPLGLVACGGMVWQASYAAFTAQTSNAANSWSTGTVNLWSNATGQAMFSATNLKPGTPDKRCIGVTSDGTLPTEVRLFGAVTGDTTLAQHLHLTIQVGQVPGGTAFPSCTGFTASTDLATSTVFTGTLAEFGTQRSSWGSSTAGSWTAPGAPTLRTYQVEYYVMDSAPREVQNTTVGVAFTWEARST